MASKHRLAPSEEKSVESDWTSPLTFNEGARHSFHHKAAKISWGTMLHLDKPALGLVILGAGSVVTSVIVLALHYSYKEPCLAYVDMDRIMFQLELWKDVYGYYPSNLREMVIKGDSISRDSPGLDEYPKDPYGGEFKLEFVNSKPNIIFYGRDGVPGGTGEDRDWRWPQDRDGARRVLRDGVIR